MENDIVKSNIEKIIDEMYGIRKCGKKIKWNWKTRVYALAYSITMFSIIFGIYLASYQALIVEQSYIAYVAIAMPVVGWLTSMISIQENYYLLYFVEEKRLTRSIVDGLQERVKKENLKIQRLDIDKCDGNTYLKIEFM